MDVPQHGEGGGDAGHGGIGHYHDVGQSGLAHLVDGDHRARQLQQAQDALLHARAAGGGDDDQRRPLHGRQAGRRHQRLAHRDAHGATHEPEVEGGDHRRLLAQGAVGDDDGVIAIGLRLGLLQAVGVALAVAELERVDRDLRQFDGCVFAVVEQQFQSFLRADAHVVAAVAADELVLLQLAVEQHLLALRAFVPEMVGHVLLAD